MKNTETAGIERDFPAWMVWVSRQGAFWGAVRRDPNSNLTPTVIADSPDELRAALAVQSASVELGK